jgi:hypothetical protein
MHFRIEKLTGRFPADVIPDLAIFGQSILP